MTANQRYSLLVLLMVIATTLPWIQFSQTSFTVAPYDLSEWMTLHPTVRSLSPNLLMPALLLRLTLLFSGWIILLSVLSAKTTWQRWGYSLIAMPFALMFLPPVAFFRGNFSDPNYQQQAVIWVVYGFSLIVVASQLQRPHKQWAWLVIGVMSVASIVVSVVGLVRAHDLISRYEIHVEIGEGFYLYLLAVGLLLLQATIRWRSKKKADS